MRLLLAVLAALPPRRTAASDTGASRASVASPGPRQHDGPPGPSQLHYSCVNTYFVGSPAHNAWVNVRQGHYGDNFCSRHLVRACALMPTFRATQSSASITDTMALAQKVRNVGRTQALQPRVVQGAGTRLAARCGRAAATLASLVLLEISRRGGRHPLACWAAYRRSRPPAPALLAVGPCPRHHRAP